MVVPLTGQADVDNAVTKLARLDLLSGDSADTKQAPCLSSQSHITPKNIQRPVRLGSPQKAVIPATQHLQAVGDDVNRTRQVLDGEVSMFRRRKEEEVPQHRCVNIRRSRKSVRLTAMQFQFCVKDCQPLCCLVSYCTLLPVSVGFCDSQHQHENRCGCTPTHLDVCLDWVLRHRFYLCLGAALATNPAHLCRCTFLSRFGFVHDHVAQSERVSATPLKS